MSVRVTYVPPRLDATLLLRGAAAEAVDAAAHVVLDASQPGVPVEEGVLKASGRVVREDGLSAAITYGRDDDGDGTHAPSNQYAVKQHEDMTLNHPNGGGPKWLETALHSAGERAVEAMSVALRKALD